MEPKIYTSIDITCAGFAKAIIVGPGGWGSVTDALPVGVAISAAKSWANTLGVQFVASSHAAD